MITCVTPAARASRNNNDINNEIKNNSKKSDALEKVLFDATRSNLELELKELQQHMSKPSTVTVRFKGKDKDKDKVKTKSKARKPRNVKFEKLLKLSNVHINLHLTNNAREYTTVMNSNMLIKGLKYKLSTSK